MEYNPKVLKAILDRSERPYFWRAAFNDGNIISEFTPDLKGTIHEILYREVLERMETRGGLVAVSWVPCIEGLPTYVQHLESWQRPVIFRRHKLHIVSGENHIIYALGWQATIADRNYKSITYFDPEDFCNTDVRSND